MLPALKQRRGIDQSPYVMQQGAIEMRMWAASEAAEAEQTKESHSPELVKNEPGSDGERPFAAGVQNVLLSKATMRQREMSTCLAWLSMSCH